MTDAVPSQPAHRYDPFNANPRSVERTVECPSCRSTQPVFDDPLFGARCARCASPVPRRPPTA